MKLLFDQNISFRILKLLENDFRFWEQVRTLGLDNESDFAIWTFAKENNYTIVTFDADFFDISNINGHPPKIIWLNTGNLITKNIAKLLFKNSNLIKEFICDKAYKELSCLQLNH